MIKQIPVQQFESEDKQAKIFVENDMPIGKFHDFLLKVKGQMVDLMIKSQKEEEEMAKQQKAKEDAS